MPIVVKYLITFSSSAGVIGIFVYVLPGTLTWFLYLGWFAKILSIALLIVRLLGLNGRQYLESNLTKEVSINKYKENILAIN